MKLAPQRDAGSAPITAPTISIVMSVRNGMPYLPMAIDSIVSQTFQDWELVINDNCSEDGSLEYLAMRAAADTRIKFISSKVDLGAAGGRNRAFEVTGADWIAIMDSDDIALPERFERQLAFVESNPDLVAMSCLAFYINHRGERGAQTHHDLTTREAYGRYMASNEMIGLLHPGALIRRDAFEAIGGYRPEYEPAEDIDLWNRLSEQGLVLVQPELLMEYRVHGTSVSAKSFTLAHLKHQWVEASAVSRRNGEGEPPWQSFLEDYGQQGPVTKLNRWRIATGRRLYREAGHRKISGHQLSAASRFAAAVALRPVYSLTRLRSQLLSPSAISNAGTTLQAQVLPLVILASDFSPAMLVI